MAALSQSCRMRKDVHAKHAPWLCRCEFEEMQPLLAVLSSYQWNVA